MKKTFVALIILLLFVFTSTLVSAWNDCPYGEVNDSYPGKCGRYVDTDNDGVCDHSQPPPEYRGNDASTSDAAVQGKQLISGGTYHLLPISLFLVFLYIVLYVLSKKGVVKTVSCRRFWNLLLLATFLASGVLGVLLIIEVNFDVRFHLPFNILFWHVETG
ncbi:MAG TPA: hypothetical protein ENI42_00040, partial [Thermoplasmatales archaeon]|nr:hypothetical protein [Thermoplasmatales archaeon]